jgi:aquaporin Z
MRVKGVTMRSAELSRSAATRLDGATLWRALRGHWPEYLVEAWGLGVFMVSAALVTTLLEYPGSPLNAALAGADLRRALIGVAMGATAMAIVYSPWGQRSGAHLNPAVTLTFLRLGKVAPADALFYVLAQFVGGTLGVLLALQLLGMAFSEPPVRYVATQPGPAGVGVALAAELTISFGLMSVVLLASGSERFARWTGVCAGILVALFIGLEAPLSGMSMNPARSFASAAPAQLWSHLWIYFVAPVAGMLAASVVHGRFGGRVHCAKLDHPPHRRCIHCGHEPAAGRDRVVLAARSRALP